MTIFEILKFNRELLDCPFLKMVDSVWYVY